MLDDRGRLHGVFDLHCVSETAFVCALEGVTADGFRDRYSMYMMLDDIEMTVLDWQIATIQGLAAPPVSCCVLPRDRSRLGGVDVTGPPAEVADILRATAATELESSEVEAIRIRAGFPRWPQDMGPKQLPHEMGMREEFLSFEKGCYVGQETVNRVDVMGQVRRSLAGVRISGDAPPPERTELQDASGKRVGTLTSPLLTTDLGLIGLGVLKKPFDVPGTPLVAVSGSLRWEASASSLPFR